VRNALTAANMTTPNAVEDRQLPDGLHTFGCMRAEGRSGENRKIRKGLGGSAKTQDFCQRNEPGVALCRPHALAAGLGKSHMPHMR
jgi:hypothetical protein